VQFKQIWLPLSSVAVAALSAGNADRMSCPELGWRGNANNLLYAQSGSRHAGRAVAIDSCVARRPPALKASAEDAAVERLSQLVLAVPGVSLALLQQLLGTLRQKQQQQQRRRQASLPSAVGICTQLSTDAFGASCSGQAGGFGRRITSSAGEGPVLPGRITPAAAAAAAAGGAEQQSHADLGSSAAAAAVGEDSGGTQCQLGPNQLQLPLLGQPRVCKTSLGAARVQGGVQDAAGLPNEARFTEDEVARFQAGLRQCLDGVLQIKASLQLLSDCTGSAPVLCVGRTLLRLDLSAEACCAMLVQYRHSSSKAGLVGSA
jgi:hypothetical protein